MSSLTRFWFDFERSAEPSVLNIGSGVTARSDEGALGLLRAHLFEGGDLPTITRCVEGVDVFSLDPRHVLPNSGLTVHRGIWFPKV